MGKGGGTAVCTSPKSALGNIGIVFDSRIPNKLFINCLHFVAVEDRLLITLDVTDTSCKQTIELAYLDPEGKYKSPCV